MTFRAWTVLAVIAVVCAADVGTAPTTSIALRARSFRPGELMVVTVNTPPGAAEVRVEAMGRGWPAHEVRPGTWRAVAGIDLDQPPGAGCAPRDAGQVAPNSGHFVHSPPYRSALQ